MKLEGAKFRRTEDESESPEIFTAKQSGHSEVAVHDAQGALVGVWREAKFKTQFTRLKASELPAENAPTETGEPE